MLASQAGARAIGAKIVDNTVSNTAAVFDAAQAIARAKTLPDATRLQAEFFQKQFALAGAQTQELFELSSRVLLNGKNVARNFTGDTGGFSHTPVSVSNTDRSLGNVLRDTTGRCSLFLNCRGDNAYNLADFTNHQAYLVDLKDAA
ncbi:MAG: phasin family protein [Acidobacteria bacterium]|nr:phasin family protein [Acidobacteriota bacterium]